MRTFSLLSIAALAAALLSTSSVARTARADGDPQIVLGSKTIDWALQEPVADLPGPPTAIHIGYGIMVPNEYHKQWEFTDGVLDDIPISPSAEEQTFEADHNSDADFEALVTALSAPLPQYTYGAVRYWFESNGTAAKTWTYGDNEVQIPAGARVDHFKMTVAPFTIAKVIVDPSNPGTIGSPGAPVANTTIGPVSMYRAVSDGPIARIEAYGSPPTGDANCDAVANSIDALFVLQRSAGLVTSLPCEKAADVNADGSIDSLDAQLILQFAAGLIPQP